MIITSRQNTIIKQFKKPDGSIVVEGEKLIREALTAEFKLKYLLLTERSSINLPGIGISSDISQYISDTKSPRGIFAMFERPNPMSNLPGNRFCLLDGIQDPGNAGAIIRSCEAFGIDGVFLSEDSADVFNPKVVRASAGSVFRLPCVRRDLCALIRDLKSAEFKVYGTGIDERAISLRNAHFGEKSAVVIGNEGQGISESVIALCDEKLYIPISGAESLNASVAAGIICYEWSNYGKVSNSRITCEKVSNSRITCEGANNRKISRR